MWVSVVLRSNSSSLFWLVSFSVVPVHHLLYYRVGLVASDLSLGSLGLDWVPTAHPLAMFLSDTTPLTFTRSIAGCWTRGCRTEGGYHKQFRVKHYCKIHVNVSVRLCSGITSVGEGYWKGKTETPTAIWWRRERKNGSPESRWCSFKAQILIWMTTITR